MVIVGQLWFGQFVSLGESRLIEDIVDKVVYFVCGYECALDTHRFAALAVKHVSAADKLVSARSVEYYARVHHLECTESDTCRAIAFDKSGEHVCRWTLRGYDHVYANGACLLGNACYRQLNFLAGSHYKVGKFIDNNHYVWHIVMAVIGVETSFFELFVVLDDVAYPGFAQQSVSGVHLDT